MKYKRVPGVVPTRCEGCVFEGHEGCARPYGTVCELDGYIFVVDEEDSPEAQQNETKPRFNPEWGC